MHSKVKSHFSDITYSGLTAPTFTFSYHFKTKSNFQLKTLWFRDENQLYQLFFLYMLDNFLAPNNNNNNDLLKLRCVQGKIRLHNGFFVVFFLIWRAIVLNGPKHSVNILDVYWVCFCTIFHLLQCCQQILQLKSKWS